MWSVYLTPCVFNAVAQLSAFTAITNNNKRSLVHMTLQPQSHYGRTTTSPVEALYTFSIRRLLYFYYFAIKFLFYFIVLFFFWHLWVALSIICIAVWWFAEVRSYFCNKNLPQAYFMTSWKDRFGVLHLKISQFVLINLYLLKSYRYRK